jgi:hypothetical protein
MTAFPARHIVALWKAVAGEDDDTIAENSETDASSLRRRSYKLSCDEELAARDFAWSISAVGQGTLH